MGFNLKKLVSSVPVIGGAFDDTADRAAGEIRDSKRLFDNIALPDLKWSEFNPEAYTMDDAQYALTQEDPGLRSAQLSVLEKLAGLSSEGMTPEDEYAFFKARQMGDQMAKAGTAAAMQNAMARGVGGSGLEFGMREMANQSGAQRAQEAAMQQAAEAARQKALYTQAYGNALSGMRGQDASINQANTDVINRFNMANTTNRNQMNQANVDQRNRAQQYNAQGARDVQQQNFDNRITKAGGQAQQRQNMANVYAAQNAANTSERNAIMQAAVDAYAGSKKK